MTHTAVDPSFRDLIDEYAPVAQLGRGFIFTEGPIWHPHEQHLIFSDMPGDVRRRWMPDGTVSEVARPSNKGNGMTYDADLNLLVCEHSTSSVVRIAPDGTRTVLCSHYEGRELNSPNDIVVGNTGAVYFTDPTYGRMDHFGVKRPTQMGFQGVYMLRPGYRPGDEPVLVSDKYTFSQPNGLCFSPCERWLWVNDSDQKNIRMFDVASDGLLSNARVFASGITDALKPGMPDGMKADRNGNVWVTAPGGIWVYSFHGKLIGKIACPEPVANMHWGGDDWQTLFMCANTSLYSVETKVAGRIEAFMFARDVQQKGAAVPADASGESAPPHTDPLPQGESEQGALGFTIAPAKTVLIIQDMQNDVMMDGGAFAETGSPDHARQQNVVANIARLAEAARRKGMMVIHVHFLCEPGHPYLGRNATLFEGVQDHNALVRGTWGGAPVPGLEPQGADLIVEKMSMSAWETSRLESYLHRGGIDTIINTGAWTNMSIEHTARTAADKGFRVILPENACSTMNADWHRASIDYAMGNVATVTDTDAVLMAL